MKTIIYYKARYLLLMMMLPISIIAQQMKLDGTYNYNYEMEGFHYTFTGDSTFEYHHIGKGTTDNNGRGYYRYKDDSIIFTFIDFDTIKSSIEVLDVPCKNLKTKTDTTILDFKILDIGTLKPLNRAIVSLSDSRKRFIDQGMTDADGKTSIKIKNRKGDFWINVYFEGPNTHFAKIQLNGCKDIFFVYPRLGHVPIERGTVWRFKTKEVSIRKLLLQDGDKEYEFLNVKNDR